VGCTSRAQSSHSTTSQRCSIGLRSGDCGGHFCTVNLLSWSRNQFEMIRAFDMMHYPAGSSHQRIHCGHIWMDVVRNNAQVGRFKWCPIGTKGPKVCQENITPPPACTVVTRHDGSMISFCLCQILTLPSEFLNRNQDSSDQATIFQSSTFQCWWALANCSLFFLFVGEMSCTLGVFCCCSPSASRFWLHKCFAAYLGCNECLFQSKMLFYQLESVGPFSFDL